MPGILGLATLWIPLIEIGLLALGFILFVVGLVSPSQQQQQQQVVISPPSQQTQQPTPQSSSIVLAICPDCKKRIPSDTNSCPKCGTDLRPRED